MNQWKSGAMEFLSKERRKFWILRVKLIQMKNGTRTWRADMVCTGSDNQESSEYFTGQMSQEILCSRQEIWNILKLEFWKEGRKKERIKKALSLLEPKSSSAFNSLSYT